MILLKLISRRGNEKKSSLCQETVIRWLLIAFLARSLSHVPSIGASRQKEFYGAPLEPGVKRARGNNVKLSSIPSMGVWSFNT